MVGKNTGKIVAMICDLHAGKKDDQNHTKNGTFKN